MIGLARWRTDLVQRQVAVTGATSLRPLWLQVGDRYGSDRVLKAPADPVQLGLVF